ncbi:DMT family transporter [Intrasporangium calvum]|uniref:DMT family transporter n=1 Tax=Intrasporangium calvum TaxID=53358 RepID=A0ABT5GD83_9MICO|nr:DMT family transporter [Intrasporangium calvum]MDC5696202.1 DMT family transporter [Intrasporangium calvum]
MTSPRNSSTEAAARAPARTEPPATRTATWLVLAAMAVTLVLWASAFVAIRHLGHDVPPGALSLGRLLVASVALGVLVFRRRPTWPRRGDWGLLILCGVAWFGIYNLALNDAERRIDAGTAALLVQIGPIIVALLATVFLGERLTSWLVVGMVVGFAGVFIIARGFSNGGSGDRVGVWLAVIAAVTYAIGVLAQKPLLRRLPGPEVTFLACAIGVITLLPWSGELVDVIRQSDADTLLWIAYLGIFPTAVAFSLWAFVLARSDAGKLTLTTFLVPFIATLIAWALLAEVPPALTFLGGALCITGVLLTRRQPARRAGRRST